MSKQGQGKAENTCSQLGKQLHVQGSPFSGGFATLALPDCLLRGDPGTGRQRGGGDGWSHVAMGVLAHGDRGMRGSCIASWHTALHSRPC